MISIIFEERHQHLEISRRPTSSRQTTISVSSQSSSQQLNSRCSSFKNCTLMFRTRTKSSSTKCCSCNGPSRPRNKLPTRLSTTSRRMMARATMSAFSQSRPMAQPKTVMNRPRSFREPENFSQAFPLRLSPIASSSVSKMCTVPPLIRTQLSHLARCPLSTVTPCTTSRVIPSIRSAKLSA